MPKCSTRKIDCSKLTIHTFFDEPLSAQVFLNMARTSRKHNNTLSSLFHLSLNLHPFFQTQTVPWVIPIEVIVYIIRQTNVLIQVKDTSLLTLTRRHRNNIKSLCQGVSSA